MELCSGVGEVEGEACAEALVDEEIRVIGVVVEGTPAPVFGLEFGLLRGGGGLPSALEADDLNNAQKGDQEEGGDEEEEEDGSPLAGVGGGKVEGFEERDDAEHGGKKEAEGLHEAEVGLEAGSFVVGCLVSTLDGADGICKV